MKTRIFLSIFLLVLFFGCTQPVQIEEPYIEVPVIEVFEANPAIIQQGNLASLRWKTSGAKTVSIDPGIGDVAPSGSIVVTPSSTTTYTLTAENEYYSTNATTVVTVESASNRTVVSPPLSSLPVIKNFSVQPSLVLKDQTATLSWEVQNADDVKIEPGLGLVIHSGNQEVTPLHNITYTTYRLTASNSKGSVEATTTVTVDEDFITEYSAAVKYFTASNYIISKGQSTILRWETVNGSSVIINQKIGIVKASGAMEVTPSETTTYLLTVTDPEGAQFQTVTINVK